MALFARANVNAAFLTNNCYFFKLTSQDIIFRSIATHVKKYSTSKKLSDYNCIVNSPLRHNITSNLQRNFVRKCHFVPYNKNYVPFEELLAERRNEASRSILVQVQSPDSHLDLQVYCEQFGIVNTMHHYAINKNMHFYLVEFNESSSVDAAMKSATHINYHEAVPVESSILWFRNISKGDKKLMKNKPHNSPSISKYNSTIPNIDELTEQLLKVESISEQMILLHDAWKLDELGIRLRFLTAYQIERSFVGLFPHITVSPFGSSVNGFGKRGCDLDLVLMFQNHKTENKRSRFVFHTKSMSQDNIMHWRKFMEIIADSIQAFVPGVSNVRKILAARVPIIKYDQIFTGLECDLSMTNQAGIYMSELLCLYGEIDYRVRPLVFTIRQWAKNIGLTNPAPGRWISNFSLTLLVLFYLQQKNILPCVDTLKNLAGSADVRLTDNSVDCTFLRDVKKLPVQTMENEDDLGTLLHGFFEFYASFDFSAKAICLRSGTTIFKPDFSPFYISNPLEVMLNVSKNITIEETERIRLALRNAAWMLDDSENDKVKDRGLFAIFDKKADIINYVAGKRTVDVAALFQIPSESASPDNEKTLNDKTKSKNVKLDANLNRVTKIKKGRARR